MATASRTLCARLLSGNRKDALHIGKLGQVRWAWQAPSCDCYALLGVPSTASNTVIKAAYLQKAKRVHPDRIKGSGGSSEMVQLNLCYEALTQRRTEYDVAKGTGTASQRREAAYAAGREPWWKNQSRDRQDPFHDFSADWEEAFTRQWYTHQRERPKAKSNSSWQQWAETWRYEMDDEEDESIFSKQRGKRGGSRKRQAERYDSDDERFQRQSQGRRRTRASRYHDTDSTDSDDYDEEFFEPRSRSRKKSNKQHRQKNGHDARDQEAEAENQAGTSSSSSEQTKDRSKASKKEPPTVLLLKGLGRGRVAAIWDLAVGKYYRLDRDFNNRPAYAQRAQAEDQAHYLFWSQFGDWKLGDRLIDDGTCIAFADDPKGRNPPWITGSPWWRIFDPASRRFVYRRLAVKVCTERGGEPKNNDEHNGDNNDQEVPWSRSHWSKWSTADLLRWCGKQGIDINGCFDREAVLERVAHAVESSATSNSRSGIHFGSKRSSSAEGDSDSGTDSDSDSDGFSARPHGKRGKRQTKHDDAEVDLDADIQIASRVKTDGSYTRRPSLDTRVSLYGNRIEPFYGEENAILPWLHRFGDKSRLYGIFRDGDFGYSLVWKKQKYWGKPGHKQPRESWE